MRHILFLIFSHNTCYLGSPLPEAELPIRHSGAAAPATAGVAPYPQLLLPNLLCVALFLDSSIRTESEGTCSEGWLRDN